MPTSQRDEEFGTYGERKPRIVRQKMVVGEQQEVGLEGQALADALDSAAKAEPTPEPDEEPEAQPAAEAPEGGEPEPTEPAPTAAEPEPQATVLDQPTEPEPAEPVETEPQPQAAAPETPAPEGDAVTISRAEYEELKSNGLRQADYTRKTQALAELRKTSDADAQRHRESRDEYLKLIDEVTNLLREGTREPNWAEARRTMSPEAYADLRDAWAARKSDLDAATAERKRVADKKAEDDAKLRDDRVKEERERLYGLKPELRDAAKLRSWLTRMKQTARDLGFTDQEFDGVGDHRLFLLLDRASGAKGAPVPSNRPTTTKPPVRSPRSVGPGAAQPPKVKPNEKEQARERLHREHSVEAGGEFIASLLE